MTLSMIRTLRTRVRLDLEVDPVRIARVVACAARLRISRNIQAQLSHAGDPEGGHVQCSACGIIGEINERAGELDAAIDDLFRAQPDFHASIEATP